MEEIVFIVKNLGRILLIDILLERELISKVIRENQGKVDIKIFQWIVWIALSPIVLIILFFVVLNVI